MEVLRRLRRACCLRACLPAAPQYGILRITAPFTFCACPSEVSGGSGGIALGESSDSKGCSTDESPLPGDTSTISRSRPTSPLPTSEEAWQPSISSIDDDAHAAAAAANLVPPQGVSSSSES